MRALLILTSSLLVACYSDVDGTSATDGSSGEAGTPVFPCKKLSELSAESIMYKCLAHQWEDAPQCYRWPPSGYEDCLELMGQIIPRCPDLTLCEYVLCADERAESPCGILPSSCAPILACVPASGGSTGGSTSA